MTNPTDLITLPEGGGAQSGLGESFAPDLFTGTGNFTVPVAVPNGRNSVQPSLNLVYSTGHGNGVFGLGWGLSVPRIVRKTADGVPSYDDELDKFLLSGTTEELVPSEGNFPGVVSFSPRTEGLFAKINFHRDEQVSFWDVRTKDGFRSLYGSLDDTPSVTRDPSSPDRIFAWHLRETSDPFGNRINYDYEVEETFDNEHRGTQTYLRSIRYINTPSASEENFLVSIDFDYGQPEDIRPDPFSNYKAGFEIRTRRRCRQVIVTINGEQPRVSRRYDFIYLDELVALGERAPTSLPKNGMSLLARIRVTGLAETVGQPDQPLPALDFDYSQFRPETRRFRPITGLGLPPSPLNNPRLELVDLNGNGLPDFLETNGTYRYWSNLGEGQFDLPRTMSEAPLDVALGTRGVSALDINGDGRLELMVTGSTIAGYYQLDADGRFDRRGFRRIDTAPSFDPADPDVQLIDLDGNGATDAVRAGTDFECFFADRDHGWNRVERHPRGAPGSFPDVSFSDPRVRIADMTGDGLSDIVLIHDRNVDYWPNLGHGRWGERVSMRDAPILPVDYLPQQVLLGDVDGDGLHDLIFIDHCKISVWFNQSGNGWSAPTDVPGTPRFTLQSDIRLVDLLGVGTAGILWSDATGQDGVADYRFLDLTGGTKPYLLDKMDNNLGAVTEVSYRSSCEDFVRDRASPETRWKTSLPIPIQVVGRVDVTDHFSGNRLVTEYSYRHGHYDGDERTFVGFGHVRVRDAEFEVDDGAETAEPFAGFDVRLRTPPTERLTWFDLGPVGPGHGDWREIRFENEYWEDDPPGFPQFREERADFLRSLPQRRHRRDALRAVRGTMLREELFALDDDTAPYTVKETIRHVLTEHLPEMPDEKPVFFAFDVAMRTTQWDRGDDPLTTIEISGDHDGFGQARRQIALACPRGWQGFAEPRDNFLATMSVTSFAQREDDELFVVDRPAQMEAFELASTLDDAPVLVEDLALAALAGTATATLLGRDRNFYDGPAFEGLPLNQIGDFGALVRSEKLALTSAQLDDALEDAPDPSLPPFFDLDAPPQWPETYPEPFQTATGASAGYTQEAMPDGTHFYIQTQRLSYDFHEADPGPVTGLVRRMLDPKGHETAIIYDDFSLFPAEVTGPTGLVMTAAYDYRVMQPSLVVDPNGNRTRYRYTPLGLLASVATMGPEGEAVGDAPDTPSMRYLYDLLAFENSPEADRQPISVTTIQRHFHANGAFDDPVPRDLSTRTVEYSDGFGRLLQTRADAEQTTFGDEVFGEDAGLPVDQAVAPEPAVPLTVTDRVRVSGAVTYDSKGRAIETFEPFFDIGLAYATPADQQIGRRSQIFYDAVGRQLRTRSPDGAESWTVPGIPLALDTPSDFAPTPWENYAYDANDLAPLSQSPVDDSSLAASAPADHAFTPSNIEIDALGRTIRSVERLGPDQSDELTTRTRYDIRGNPLEVTDALGRVAFRYRYDQLNRVLRTDSIDAGLNLSFTDAAGLPLEQRDSKGALALSAYDALNRPTDAWARDRTDLPVTLREHLIYGDTAPPELLSADEARDRNLLGQLFQHYDGAGRVTAIAHDHKGNPQATTREVFSDQTLLTALDAPIEDFQIDWTVSQGDGLDQLATQRLDPTVHRTDIAYDALNRPIQMDHPEDVEGQRRRLRLGYSLSGALETVVLDGDPIVEHIAYDAKGQRTLIAYGNGVMTRYAYDANSLRLRRLRSERFDEPSPLTFLPTGAAFQDFGYRYDLLGNIFEITDRTPESGVLNNPDAGGIVEPALAQLLASGNALIRRFSYDPLYRLTAASGREHDRPTDDPPWRDDPKTTDFTLTRAYTENYRYDVLGNLEQLSHLAGPAGSFSRNFTLQLGAVPGIAANNRLQRMSVGGEDFDYAHDAAGNMLSETSSRRYHWNVSNQLKGFEVRAGTGVPSVSALYLYGADGARVKKLVRRQGGGVHSVTTVGGFERTREDDIENDILDIADDTTRVASIRIGPAFADDTTPARKFYLPDHLGSINMVLDGTGGFVDREEVRPYGETSFGSFARKQWRFTSQRKDGESGLSHHGARYYAPWLGRWTAADPIGFAGGPSAYAYGAGNPINLRDVLGLRPGDDAEKATNLIWGSPPAQPSLEENGPLVDNDPEALGADAGEKAKIADFIENDAEVIKNIPAETITPLSGPELVDQMRSDPQFQSLFVIDISRDQEPSVSSITHEEIMAAKYAQALREARYKQYETLRKNAIATIGLVTSDGLAGHLGQLGWIEPVDELTQIRIGIVGGEGLSLATDIFVPAASGRPAEGKSSLTPSRLDVRKPGELKINPASGPGRVKSSVKQPPLPGPKITSDIVPLVHTTLPFYYPSIRPQLLKQLARISAKAQAKQ